MSAFDNRMYLCTYLYLFILQTVLIQGLRTREEEDRVSSHLLLKVCSRCDEKVVNIFVLIFIRTYGLFSFVVVVVVVLFFIFTFLDYVEIKNIGDLVKMRIGVFGSRTLVYSLYKTCLKILLCLVFLFCSLSVLVLFQAIANACKVPAASVSELSESDVCDECEKQFNEDQELEQLINGQICFKIYPFSSGMVK